MIINSAEEYGYDLFGQCIKCTIEEKIEDTFVTLSLNILGVIYSVQVPKHEMADPKNVKDAWTQLIRDFGVCHMLGQSKRVQDGHRDLTEEEQKMLEEQEKKGLKLIV